MAIATLYKRFLAGIGLVPNATTQNSVLGDLESLTSTNRLMFFGASNDAVTTDGVTATLTNKTIAAGSNTITGLVNANLSGSAGITVPNGGTGQATLAIHGVLVGNGTSGITTLAAAAAGTLLAGQGTGSDPAFSAAPTLGVNATTAGSLGIANGGTTGATIKLQNLGATTAYNFNLPTTVGSSGQVLTSQAGGSNSMTWSTIAAGNFAVTSQSTTYPILTTDGMILCDASGAAFTVTLPTAVGVAGKQYIIKKTDTTYNAVTIATTSSQTIDGVTTRLLSTQKEEFTLTSDGTNWQITDHYILTILPAYTPVIVGGGGGTVNYTACYRQGIFLVTEMSYTPGATPTSVEARIPLPTGLTTISTLPTLMQCGEYLRSTSSVNHGGYILKEASKTYVTLSGAFVIGGGSGVALNKEIGTNIFDPGSIDTYRFSVQIAGWEG